MAQLIPDAIHDRKLENELQVARRLFQRPVPVGSYAPNAWGLYDTAGNVWEWVADWYGAEEYKRHASAVAVDPQGPGHGDDRVLRGGRWSSNDYTGFRLALDRT